MAGRAEADRRLREAQRLLGADTPEREPASRPSRDEADPPIQDPHVIEPAPVDRPDRAEPPPAGVA